MGALKGKIILITGASRGIGAATARLAGEGGACVVVNYNLRKDEAERVVADIKNSGGEAFSFGADVRDREQVARMMLATKEEYGRLDVLINNAGVAFWKTFPEISIKEEELTIEVNLKGVLICTREALKLMLAQKEGVIVNIASGSGKRGHPGLSVYSASKFGVVGFTQAAGQELDERGVRMYAVCPGATATDMTGGAGMATEKVAEKILQVAKEKAGLVSGGELKIYS